MIEVSNFTGMATTGTEHVTATAGTTTIAGVNHSTTIRAMTIPTGAGRIGNSDFDLDYDADGINIHQ